MVGGNQKCTPFNPEITTAQYEAMSPADQQQWDRDLLKFWDDNEDRRIARDDAKDAGEHREENNLGGGLPLGGGVSAGI